MRVGLSSAAIERINLVSVLTGAQLLKPVDFALNGGALPFAPQPFERADALGGSAPGDGGWRRCS